MNKETFLPASILIAGVLIAGAVIYSTGLKNQPVAPNNGLTANAIDQAAIGEALNLTKDDVVLGDIKAPVTLIEYSDFQCPFCGRFFSQTEPLIKENYVKTGKVKFVYRHFPFLGPESKAAASAAECAKEEGKFWEYHDALFNAELKDGQENSGNLNKNLFISIAKNLGLNTDNFSSCLNSDKYANKVSNDYSLAQKIGVRATPTTFINGNKLEGAYPFAQFKSVIEQALSK